MLSPKTPRAYERLQEVSSSRENTPFRKSRNSPAFSQLTRAFNRRDSTPLKKKASATATEPLLSKEIPNKNSAIYQTPTTPKRSSPHPAKAIMPRSSTWTNVPPSSLPRPVSGLRASSKTYLPLSQSTASILSNSRKTSPPSRIPTPLGGLRRLSNVRLPSPYTTISARNGTDNGSRNPTKFTSRKPLTPTGTGTNARISDVRKQTVSMPHLLKPATKSPASMKPRGEAVDHGGWTSSRPGRSPVRHCNIVKQNNIQSPEDKTASTISPRAISKILPPIPSKRTLRPWNCESSIVQDAADTVLLSPKVNRGWSSKSKSDLGRRQSSSISSSAHFEGVIAPAASPAVSSVYGERLSVSNENIPGEGESARAEDERTPLVARLKSSFQSVRSPLESLRSSFASTPDDIGPYVKEAQCSQYWSGRYMSLQDKLLNEIGFYEEALPSSEESFSLHTREMMRALNVFRKLEAYCVTDSAKQSLFQFRNNYAKRRKMPELAVRSMSIGLGVNTSGVRGQNDSPRGILKRPFAGPAKIYRSISGQSAAAMRDASSASSQGAGDRVAVRKTSLLDRFKKKGKRSSLVDG